MPQKMDGKVNILIVDDKPDKVLALEALLEDLGQNIVRAYSGREALRRVLENDFAVILLDVNMPGMDGFETAELIRQRASSRHVPIIFVTAFGEDSYSARGYSLGAVDYIQTPVVPDVLKTKVAVFVDLFAKSEQVRRQAESLRRRAAQLQKLAAASVAMSSALSADRMLQTVTDTARDVLGAHQAITVFLDPRPSSQQHRKVQAYTSYSDKYAEWRDEPLELDAIADTAVFRSYSATRLSEQELLVHPDWDIVKQVRIPPVRGGMLAAPLTGRDGSRLGVIYLCDKCDGSFSADDESIVVQLAQMASIALENSIFAQEREANRIKDEFLSTLSHELRTPLNAILGWTQLLRIQQPTPEDFSHGLEVIERNAQAQTKLVEDLLDVSRITSGKLRLKRRQIRLSDVINSALDAIRPLASDKKVAICWNGVSEDDSTVGDADRLQQVAWNLLSNAVKFTPSDGRVEVRLDRVNGHHRMQILDTGKGIAPNFLPHVFDRFRQADSSSTRTHGGLGIGLTIVRHIVELHGGTVHAESPGEGMGATFSIMLPPAIAESRWEGDLAPAEAAPAVRAPSNGSPTDRPLAAMRVLIVDDEPDTRELMMHSLSRAGAVVESASSVGEAIELIDRQMPDVIVSDIAMPEQDGYDLIRQVRRTPQGQKVPAIAVTAYAREEDRTRASLAGFQRHLAKPFEPAELVAIIAELCGPGLGARGLQPQVGQSEAS